MLFKHRARLLRRIGWVLGTALAGLTASAQNWQADPIFAPVLESIQIPSVQPTALADGRVLVLTDAASIDGRLQGQLVRFNANGTLDTTYTPPTFLSSPQIAYTYPDGRVLLFDQDTRQLVRLLANGARDPAFRVSTVDYFPGGRAIPTDDDRLLLWGGFDYIDGYPARFLRLLPDGGRDPSFTPPTTLYPYDVAVQADGKLVIGGGVQMPDGSYRTMIRLNADGTPDSSFNASATLPSGSSETAADVVAVLPEGRIHVSNYHRTWRLLTDGANDPTYPAPFASNFAYFLFRATASGIFYFTESVGSGNYQLRRLNVAGTIDPNFKVRGLSDSNLRFSSTDDRTFFVGASLSAARLAGRQLLTHVLPDGSTDSAFAARFSRAGGVSSVFRQADGKYIVYGEFDRVAGQTLANTWFNLVRLNADGSLDASYVAPPGIVIGTSNYPIQPIALQPDGRLLVSTIDGVRRLTANGSFDSTFPTRTGTSQQYDQNGTIYPVTASGVTRLLPDGTPDPSFAAAAVGAPQVTADGRIIYFNATTRRFTRLLANGTVDPSFSAAVPELTRSVAWSALPNGGVFVLGQVYSISTSTLFWTVLRSIRFDPQGNRVFSADTFGGGEVVAALFYDAVQAAGGGHAQLAAGNLSEAYAVDVSRRGEAMLLTNSPYANTGTIHQLRLPDSATSAISLVPVITNQARDISTRRGSVVSLYVNVWGQHPFSFQWSKDGIPLGAPHVVSGPDDTYAIPNARDPDAGVYQVTISNALGSVTSEPMHLSFPDLPKVSTAPVSQAVAFNGPVNLKIDATGDALPSVYALQYSWSQNGGSFWNSLGNGNYPIANFTSANTGVYRMFVQGAGGTLELPPAILGIATTEKAVGSAHEIGANIVHPNGNTFDQVALDGASATVTADNKQVTRVSFLDLNDDIVQLEFSGAGTMSVLLDGPSGPAAPAKYNQPDVSYMKGHAIITIVGADETTNVGVFSVGKATATNPALFRTDVTYDGIADIALIAIASSNGKFGSIRAANASFWATRGFTGIYAPGVTFTGPVYLGDIDARSSAIPKLILGGSIDVRITGGDLLQTSNRAIGVKGVTKLTMTAGTTSQGDPLVAKMNQARLEEDDVDVTARIVVNPTP